MNAKEWIEIGLAACLLAVSVIGLILRSRRERDRRKDSWAQRRERREARRERMDLVEVVKETTKVSRRRQELLDLEEDMEIAESIEEDLEISEIFDEELTISDGEVKAVDPEDEE